MTEPTGEGTARGTVRYSDGIAAAQTLIALEAKATALQRRLPAGWDLAPYAGDDLRGTTFRGTNIPTPNLPARRARRPLRRRREVSHMSARRRILETAAQARKWYSKK